MMMRQPIPNRLGCRNNSELILIKSVNYALKDLIDAAVALYGQIHTLSDIVVAQRLRLLVVYGQALAYRLGIVIATTRFLASKHHTVHQLVLGYFKSYDCMYFLAATLHHFFEGLCLRYRARKTVKDDAFGCLIGIVVQFVFKHTQHQFVRNKLALRNVGVCGTAQFGAACDMVAKDLARRNVMQVVAVYEFFALGTLSAAGRPENYKI